jgi:hypothetical protein
MLAPNSSYSISSLAALREVNALTSPMTKTQAESVLASFVAKGWLLKSKYVRSLPKLSAPLMSLLPQKGSFLSISTLLTRAPALPQVYVSGRSPGMQELLRGGFRYFYAKRNKSESKRRRRQILTRGYACPKAGCKVRLHNACYETHRRTNGNKCPDCREDWGRPGSDKVLPVGEAAAPKDEWPRRTRRSLTESEDGKDDTNVPMAEPAEAESSRAPARRNPQRATSAR